MSDKIKPYHLARKAILYVRQSSAHQVLHSRESQALQYATSRLRDSGTGSSGGTHVAPSERWRSGWDHEFESPLLQRRVHCEPDTATTVP